MWKLFKKKKTKFPCYIQFEEIKKCYQQKCEEFGIVPNLRVLQKLKKARIKPRVSLRDLQLDNFQISAFLEVLLLSSTREQWKTIILTGNQISDISCHFMAHIIEKCKNIEKLDLSNNNISVDGVRLIHEACLRRKSKLILNISRNPLIDRKDSKRFVVACRDLKDADSITDVATELRATEFEDVTSMDDDLTTFSPNSEMLTSPNADLDTSIDAHEHHYESHDNHNYVPYDARYESPQDASLLSTEIIDSSHSVMEANESRFSMTADSFHRSSMASDLLSPSSVISPSAGGFPTSPKLLYQASFLNRNPNEQQVLSSQSNPQTTPSRKMNNDSRTDSKKSLVIDVRSETINSPSSVVLSEFTSTPNSPKTNQQSNKPTSPQHAIDTHAYPSSDTTPQMLSSPASPSTPIQGTPLSNASFTPAATTSPEQNSDYTSDLNTASNDQMDFRIRSPKSVNPTIQMIKDGGEIKKSSPKQRTSVASIFNLSRIFRGSPKESPNSEQKKQQGLVRSSETTTLQDSPQQVKTNPQLTDHVVQSDPSTDSPATKNEMENTPVIPTLTTGHILPLKSIAAIESSILQSSPRSQHDSMSSQKVHYASSAHEAPFARISDQSKVHATIATSPLLKSQVVKAPEAEIATSPISFGTSLDPKRNDESPTELNAVSRDISELSGVESMGLHQEDEFPYDVDDTDEDLHEVEDILNAINGNSQDEGRGRHQRRTNRPSSALKTSEERPPKKWIRPDIYVIKKRSENAKRILEDKEQEDVRPVQKKVLKRVRQDERKKREYLFNTFSISVDAHDVQTSSFQYETPKDQQFFSISKNHSEMDEFSVVPLPFILSKANGSTARQSNSMTLYDSSMGFRNSKLVSSEESESEGEGELPLNEHQPENDNVASTANPFDDGDHNDSDIIDDSLEKDYIITARNEVLPKRDCLPEQLFAISLRGSRLDYIPLKKILPEPSFDSLVCLDLSFNSILELGQSLRPLQGLKILNLRGNKLTSLQGISYLIHLEQLDVACNHLSDASHLENLINLQVLDLSYNYVQYISSLRMLSMNKNLTVLNLEGNHVHLRNEKELRVSLVSFMTDKLEYFCHQPSLQKMYKNRKVARDAKVDEVRKKKELPIIMPNTSINIARRVSLQERYKVEVEEKKREKLIREKKNEKTLKEEKIRVKEAKQRLFVNPKWQQLNSIPRLETPRYSNTEDLYQDLNSTLKQSNTILDSILDYASPRLSTTQKFALPGRAGVANSSRAPSELLLKSGLQSNIMGEFSQSAVRSQKLFDSVSRDIEDLNTSMENEKLSPEETWIMRELKEDVNATYMAFYTFTDYINRKAHFAEFLDLQKLYHDCSLFDPLRIDISTKSALYPYYTKSKHAKEKLKSLFESHLETLELQSVATKQESAPSLPTPTESIHFAADHTSNLSDNNTSFDIFDSIDNVHGSIDD